MEIITLDKLGINKSACIRSVECPESSLRRHMLDMGLTPGTEVTHIKTAPMGDPIEIRIRGYELTLRKEDAAYIKIIPSNSGSMNDGRMCRDAKPLRMDGMGKYHVLPKGGRLREGERITLALAGNQNSGKTTLFNALTGSNQHVGNFPGVTVDRKDGVIKGYPDSVITDLPGIYSLSPYSDEERVTREFLLGERPGGIINIIDATNIERNLYLTLQLIELEIPMVIALNMMDEVRADGGSVMVTGLEELLGVPVVPISAARGEGIAELSERAIRAVQFRECPGRPDFYTNTGVAGNAVQRCIRAIIHIIGERANSANIPVRFAATKVLEGDNIIIEALKLTAGELETVERIIGQMEQECGCDRLAVLADVRFSFIVNVCRLTVTKPRESRGRRRSATIDRILTGRFTAIPAFAVIITVMFYLTFSVVGKALSGVMEAGVVFLTESADKLLTVLSLNPVVLSLVIDGVLAGVGSVLSFLPVIVVLFFFLSVLEDSGYMARVAFVMDKPFRKIGLSGRSFVPALIGFGCSVPAVMATRTIPSDRDRRLTILLLPFMSCSAKLPVYAFFTHAFFRKYAVLVMAGLYFGGIAVAVLLALLLKKFAFRGEPVPFVMELPDYRMPGAKSVFRLMRDKAKDFLTRAFTVIFAASVIIWFLQTFDDGLKPVSDPQNSLLAVFGSFIAPVFEPLGFGDWRAAAALVTGFIAKEGVVSTLTVLLGGASPEQMFSPLSAVVFLVFCLLYTPCIAAAAAVRNELSTKDAAVLCVLQCGIAWITAFAVKIIFSQII